MFGFGKSKKKVTAKRKKYVGEWVLSDKNVTLSVANWKKKVWKKNGVRAKSVKVGSRYNLYTRPDPR